MTAVALSALVSLSATAEPKKMMDTQLDQVVAAGTEGECGCKEKGNNGWGNGTDGITPGSDNGGTAASKTANGSVPTAGSINVNPVSGSDGR